MATNNPAGRSSRTRSPSYPGIPLELAIERARTLYAQEGRNAAPVSAVASHWGYKFGTSSSNINLAALKKFGLLEDKGARENRLARLTDLALDILLNPSPTHSIQSAALMPNIHRELYEKYGTSLPSDASLRHELIIGRHFTESGATDFIEQFRKTLAFAKLDTEAVSEADTAADQTAVPTEAPAPKSSPPGAVSAVAAASTPAAAGGLAIPIPLLGGASVTVSGSFPISESAWQQLMHVLEAMKPGLVIDDDRSAEP